MGEWESTDYKNGYPTTSCLIFSPLKIFSITSLDSCR